ncbi:MAG TPA: metallophosphoesterase [Methanosphaera sp.]|nr:metallophosphoesterase [Methanosphaera sp.]
MKKRKQDKPKKIVQTAMNKTRKRLNKGKFKEDSFEVVPLMIESDKIDDEFDGYKLVHITDIHMGQWITREKLEGVVEIINGLKADAIVITGDYVSYQADGYLEDLEFCLKKLEAHDVVLSVLGNHDYWTKPDEIKSVLKNSNIINLENEIYTIYRNNKKLQIAGIDCVTEGKDDIEEIEKKLDHNFPAIMLVHEPDFADTTCKLKPFILQLSGHSHGGQISVPKLRTPVRGKNFRKYPSGEYHVEDMVQYTNRGIGTNLFWFRINCPPEITEIILKKG